MLLLTGCTANAQETPSERYPRHGWSSPHMAYPGPPAKGPNGKVHI